MQVAIITGASRGLGAALAERLAADGWALVLDARGEDELRRVASRLAPAPVTALPGDVADPVHRRALVDAARAFGRVDVLVNNASALGPSPLPHLARVPLDGLDDVLLTNVVAPVGLIQEALPLLRRSGGTIVNVSSDAAVEAYEGWGSYGASKAALDHASRVLAAEEPDVRVYAFDPGDMNTRMHQDAFPGEDITDRPSPHSVVPRLLRLLEEKPSSGRFRSSDLAKAVR